MTDSLQKIRLEALRPEAVEHYLLARGWKVYESRPGIASYWRAVRDHEEFEVLCPLDRNLRDYRLRIAELLRTLEAAEDRPASAIAIELRDGGADVVKARIDRSDIRGGLIPLVAGARAFQGARDLVIAAACAEVEPRPVHPSLVLTKAKKMLKGARLGQTAQSSYVITLVSPLPMQQAELLPGLAPPIERRIFTKLATALAATRDAAEAATDGAFQKAVSAGVSANFCLAIAKFGSKKYLRALEFDMDWSWTSPVAPAVPRHVGFSPQLVRTVLEFGRAMKMRTPVNDFPLRGEVIRLQREGEREGTILVRSTIEGKPVRVRMVLLKPAYEVAIEAHQKKAIVTCRGELRVRGGEHMLLGVRDFAIVPGTEIEPLGV